MKILILSLLVSIANNALACDGHDHHHHKKNKTQTEQATQENNK
jgi:hypothetical protein